MSEECPHEGGPSQSTQSTLSPSQDMASCSQSKPQSQPGSGSSSGPTTSSQSSSGSGTLSSVDTLPVTLPSVPEEPETEPWGRLLPMARGFRSHGGCFLVLVLVLLVEIPAAAGPQVFSASPWLCFVQTVLRISTCLVGTPSVATSWMIRRTKVPEGSRSTARSTSGSTG